MGHCIVALYVGEGLEREQCCLLSCHPAFSHFPHYPQVHWALLVLIIGWGGGLCTFWDPVDPSNRLFCESGSFFGHKPSGFYRCFEALVPCAGTLSRSLVVPPGLSAYKYGTAPSARQCPLPALPYPIAHLLPYLLVSMNVFYLTPWLLDFHMVWFSGISGCFFVFKLVVVLLVVWGRKTYIPMPPSWPEVPIFLKRYALLPWPIWLSWVGRVLHSKEHGFDSWSRHMPWLWASPQLVYIQERDD